MVLSRYAGRSSDTVRMPAQGGHDGVTEERGTAIWYLLVAVVLFGALAYVFLQGSRSNVSMITDEAAKTAAYQSQDCTNAVSMGMKRLQTRGCAGLISLEADGSNPHSGAPADGSCSVYHPNGGGIAPCNVVIAALPEAPLDCTTGPIGTVCTSDGAIYIGDSIGVRIYVAPADEPAELRWKTANTNTPGTSDYDDGLLNTNAMVAVNAAAHPAGNTCKNKAPAGTWYLPALSEFNLLWENSTGAYNPGPINLSVIGMATEPYGDGSYPYYWTSTQGHSSRAWVIDFIDGTSGGQTNKNRSYLVRCARR